MVPKGLLSEITAVLEQEAFYNVIHSLYLSDTCGFIDSPIIEVWSE